MRVYLAGPEVFLPDALDVAAAKKRVCAAHGLEGVFPLDPPPMLPPGDRPYWMRIYLGNEGHIRSCDGLIANLTPFRGPSADAGTVFELGFMRALGRPVMGYSNVATDFLGRTRGFLGATATRRTDGGWEDADAMGLEDFGLGDNLMIDGGIAAAGGAFEREDAPGDRWRDLAAFERCVVRLAQWSSASSA
ncbi:nucleoside 2-deoxyribosyltransferase [Roseomonas sp. JC162]|uniref:Nucleoside 2-deoxyribosyltransferase n=1 Tax=Neoroseomonas marina TaxID=1232220 RepID=A0A848EEA9_9PROT|nr:nucleoside 2-deoxyribosyltransferase [Neoroseomonas marina]NMJ41685.1 nucleoside 2-deoxyribosyltransferase [Neoroseomonas marina]